MFHNWSICEYWHPLCERTKYCQGYLSEVEVLTQARYTKRHKKPIDFVCLFVLKYTFDFPIPFKKRF